ncbi:aldo/keto reductase [Pantoea cypripedii]|uniref:aldo/keto reductase n=1 Tax=Pantoea cypripedii TaxID=55209 RepID=UPI003F6DEC25
MGFGDPTIGQHSWTLAEAESREIIQHGLENGINFYDTARVTYKPNQHQKMLTLKANTTKPPHKARS